MIVDIHLRRLKARTQRGWEDGEKSQVNYLGKQRTLSTMELCRVFFYIHRSTSWLNFILIHRKNVSATRTENKTHGANNTRYFWKLKKFFFIIFYFHICCKEQNNTYLAIRMKNKRKWIYSPLTNRWFYCASLEPIFCQKRFYYVCSITGSIFLFEFFVTVQLFCK